MPVAPGSEVCPCGSGRSRQECCAPLHRNERRASGVEELMRSRYSAYVLEEEDHLFRTWHPRTRPADLAVDPGLEWTGLEVLDVVQGEDAGIVEFRAHWAYQGQVGVLHERSSFELRAGRWVYVEGEVEQA